MSISHLADDRVRPPLPQPVRRFVGLAGPTRGVGPGAVVIDTEAWMWRPGMPRIPLEIRMSHVLGDAFVHDIRIGRRPFAIRFGLDAFVDGYGLVRIGRMVRSGPEVDQGALIAMWGEALVFPAAWIGRSDVWWKPIDDHTARLVVTGPEGPIPLDVRFNPATGLPSSCHADRYKDAGRLTPWTGEWADWRPTGRGMLVPCRMRVRWMDEAQPWLDIQVRRIEFDPPVEPELDRARRIREIAARRRQQELERSST
jgi:uncharacterized protein DUF6544